MYLEIKDVKKSYGKDAGYVQVLKGVSTGVEKGQMCVIQGTSGSGKSTLLSVISGMDTYEEGDLLSISEKVIALCQKRIVYRKDIHPGFWAKLLCRFVHVTPAGPGAGTPHKMQLIIMICGLPRVLLAAFCSAVTKLFGKKGVFYKVCGHEVDGIDGLIDYDISFKEYVDYGILNPENPSGVCDEIYEKTGVKAMIIDASDIDCVILGKCRDVTLTDEQLCEIVRDNPAGQEGQCTPFILIRKKA